jgi:hypothetical protein
LSASDTLKALSVRNASGVRSFEGLGPMGGELLDIPALPSDGLDAGYDT